MTRFSRCALCRSRWSSRWATNTSGICVQILAVRQRQVPEVEVERPHAAFYGDLSRVDAAMYIAGKYSRQRIFPRFEGDFAGCVPSAGFAELE